MPKTAVCGSIGRGPLWYGRAALRGRNHRLVRRVLLLCTGFLLLLASAALYLFGSSRRPLFIAALLTQLVYLALRGNALGRLPLIGPQDLGLLQATDSPEEAVAIIRTYRQSHGPPAPALHGRVSTVNHSIP